MSAQPTSPASAKKSTNSSSDFHATSKTDEANVQAFEDDSEGDDAEANSSDDESYMNDDVPDGDVEVEEDNLEEIDSSNIISSGRRTRGKAIDFTKPELLNAEDLEEDNDDDADFEAQDDSEVQD